ncbi:MAG: glycosyl hydrolase [Bacteroides sp.]|nr:glycosyl hydrolase [Bacteroides sp.]
MIRQILFSAIFGAATLTEAAATPLYLNDDADIEARVEDALNRMTLEEKVGLLHAQSKFSSRGVSRLGIPEVWCTDGPHGIRAEVKWDEWDQAGWTNDSCVAFPALTCLAATWNPDMAMAYGQAIGEEARYRKKTVLLGPGVNMYRSPLCGRNFEYMGEDPYLASVMVVPYVQGVQSNGVAACVKHYALNNQEDWRDAVNVVVDDRTLHEIYLPAFKAAVCDGGAWAIMGGYNLYNNEHCCHNQVLLNDILKHDWGFDGVVISDWAGVHDTREAAHKGIDMEFGTWTDGLKNGKKNAYDDYYMADPYIRFLRTGELSHKELDDKARRVLRLIMRTEMNRKRPYGSFSSPEHYAAARRIGDEGIVLLQNKGNLLPIDRNKASRILVVGENAVKMMTVGGGSSSLKVQREITPLEGIMAACPGCAVDFERGYVGDTGGEYNGVVSGQNLNETRTASQLIADAVAKAKGADYVIFFGGLNKADHQDAEGSDRLGMALPYHQDDVIEALAKANPNFIVVNISGNGVEMPWINKVPAVLQGWYVGSEAGEALADVIFGDVNPSGRLPMTFYATLNQCSAHSVGQFPGVWRDNEKIQDCNYAEGLLTGYRWIDAKKLKPLFPFGHGLSYTTFSYSKPKVNSGSMTADGSVEITVDVTNTGSREGAEVVQLYLADVKSSVPRPVKELKGFRKVHLNPGQTATVTFKVTEDMLRFYDDKAGEWRSEPGKFEAHIGSSSTDIKGKTDFNLL